MLRQLRAMFGKEINMDMDKEISGMEKKRKRCKCHDENEIN